MVLILLGLLAAVASGTIVPLMSVRFGSVVQLLVDQEMCRNHNISMPDVMNRELEEDLDTVAI